MKPKNVRKLMIPKLSKKEAQPLEKIVDRILTMKLDAGTDISALEREIDQLVYGLYDLTKEEIEIVERAGEQ